MSILTTSYLPIVYCRYRQELAILKGHKQEIEHLQHLLQKAKMRLHKEFQQWYDEQEANVVTESPASIDYQVDDDIAAFYSAAQSVRLGE
eukprot:m.224448 g.224448  ORF g.224448 m.224448 type:complete len:90 (-) comp26366_c0_seq4:151-420(-)